MNFQGLDAFFQCLTPIFQGFTVTFQCLEFKVCPFLMISALTSEFSVLRRNFSALHHNFSVPRIQDIRPPPPSPRHSPNQKNHRKKSLRLPAMVTKIISSSYKKFLRRSIQLCRPIGLRCEVIGCILQHGQNVMVHLF